MRCAGAATASLTCRKGPSRQRAAGPRRLQTPLAGSPARRRLDTTLRNHRQPQFGLCCGPDHCLCRRLRRLVPPPRSPLEVPTPVGGFTAPPAGGGHMFISEFLFLALVLATLILPGVVAVSALRRRFRRAASYYCRRLTPRSTPWWRLAGTPRLSCATWIPAPSSASLTCSAHGANTPAAVAAGVTIREKSGSPCWQALRPPGDPPRPPSTAVRQTAESTRRRGRALRRPRPRR